MWRRGNQSWERCCSCIVDVFGDAGLCEHKMQAHCMTSLLESHEVLVGGHHTDAEHGLLAQKPSLHPTLRVGNRVVPGPAEEMMLCDD